ncbi:hypothetical protein D9M70_455600 [compost metagenome]
MAHHVDAGEAGAGDAAHVAQHMLRLHQAALLALGQVDLRDVAGDHRLGAEADPGQEHLHLLGRGVLRLVEDDEGVVQRAPAHIGQRRDLDHLALEHLLRAVEAEQVIQRVVQRAQVGIDLLRQVAGQEAQALAGFHRRARQHDALDRIALQRVDRAGHRQVGLAGAGRADAEVDVVLEDRLDVALLVGAARADVALAGAQHDLWFGAGVDQFLDARFLQEQVHQVRRQLGGLGFAVQALQQLFGGLGLGLGADQFELVAAVADLDAQALLDQAQVLVELSAEVGEAAGLEGLEDEAKRFCGCVQCRG